MPKSETNPNGRRFAFTVNMYTEAQMMDFINGVHLSLHHEWNPEDAEFETCEAIRYVACDLELGNDSGIYHWQGYLEVFGQMRLKAVKKLLQCNWAHVETAFRDAECNIRYIAKDHGEFGTYRYGEPAESFQGARADLAYVHKLIKKGATEAEVCDKSFSNYVRYHQGFSKAIALQKGKVTSRRENLKIHVLWGPGGTGKSYRAFKHDPNYYTKPLVHHFVIYHLHGLIPH